MSFFFNDTATTEIYTLSLHDALPICRRRRHADPLHRRGPGAVRGFSPRARRIDVCLAEHARCRAGSRRSEEHTSELQSLAYLVCRLLLEKKKKIQRCSSRWCTNVAHY